MWWSLAYGVIGGMIGQILVVVLVLAMESL